MVIGLRIEYAILSCILPFNTTLGFRAPFVNTFKVIHPNHRHCRPPQRCAEAVQRVNPLRSGLEPSSISTTACRKVLRASPIAAASDRK
jgi:hypothetical protein